MQSINFDIASMRCKTYKYMTYPNLYSIRTAQAVESDFFYAIDELSLTRQATEKVSY